MDGMPLYVSAEKAAKYVGIGVDKMYEFMNGEDPPPYLMVGNRRLLQKAALEPYFERKQEVRLWNQ